MAGVSEEEIARLANRLAMLVSDDGEADNAGRAVGALARRLGLTGGQLKAIFVAGAESAGAQTARLAEQAARIRELEDAAAELRDALAGAEATARQFARERDTLRRQAETLRASRQTRQRRRRRRGLGVLAGVLVVAAGAAAVRYAPPLDFGFEAPAPAADPVYRSALVRDRPSTLREQPDPAAKALATLPVGTKLVVHRVLWHNLMQWVEVEFSGQTGYVPSTDVDLS